MTGDPRRDLDLTRQMVLGAETGAATSLLEDLLRRHQHAWQRQLVEHVNVPWCGLCDRGAPCDDFILGSTLLGLVELMDGTRFSRGWRGPVEDRRY